MTQITNNQRKWYLVDLEGKIYGRELTRIASILMGKSKIDYAPNLDQGDYVVVLNASKAKFTGNKIDQKMYYKHTGYLGNMKAMNLGEMLEKKPVELIMKSVGGMLPKNKLQKQRLARLKVYLSAEHPHQNVKFEDK